MAEGQHTMRLPPSDLISVAATAPCPRRFPAAGGGHGGAAAGGNVLAGVAHRRLVVEKVADLLAGQRLVFEQIVA